MLEKLIMKKLKYFLSIIITILFVFPSQSQENTTKKNERPLFGIQTGFLGVWVHNETELSPQWILRSEAGLNIGFGGGGSYNQFSNAIGVTEGGAMVASISLEPRFYYNLEKRRRNGKNVYANSANFIALNINYYPGLLIAAQNRDKVAYTQQISFIPYWAIKRTISRHFTYEAGGGLGYLHNLSVKGRGYNNFDKGSFLIYLHLRIGYTF